MKACVLAYVKRNADVIFRERRYSEKCWTHDIEELVALAGLRPQRDADASANPALWVNWQIVREWSEVVRYERKTKLKAEKLYQAIIDTSNGVLPWIRNHW